MGEVYRARDEVLERDVAVKVLPRELAADEQARARLLREARLASALEHPGVCPVFDAGEHAGRVFVVMPLIAGRPLEDMIVPGGMSPAAVASIGTQVADALAYAHAHGVVHRDLKPANVVVAPDGRTRIVDFGVARRFDAPEGARGSTRLTETGVLVGTLDYLPPEALHGHRVDAKGDLWALGVMLHRLLTGQPPFPGTTGFELSAAILNEPPAPLPATVPGPMRQVVGRCLEKDPSQRPTSAAEVRDALATFMPAGRHGNVLGVPRVPALAMVVLAVVIVGALAVFATRRWGRAEVDANTIRSIAVLPLANLSSDTSQEYFADGMTEELIQALSRVSALSVISRTSVLGYKGTRKTPRDIGRELGVNGLIEGTVRRGSDRVSVAVSLVAASSGRTLWSQDYERPMTDVLALQNDVAQQVVQEIAITLRPEEHARLAQRTTVNPEAYETYLRAQNAGEQLTEEDLHASLDLYRHALSLDSTFAPAFAGLATTYYLASNWFWAPDTAMNFARDNAMHALRLDPGLADAHSVLAIVMAHYDWSFGPAEREFRTALSLDASSSRAAEWYGYFLVEMGRFNESRGYLDRAVRLDPLNGSARFFSAWPFFYAERYDSASARLADLLKGSPNFWAAHGLLGETLEMQGDLAGALVELEKARVEGNPWIRCAIARVYARQGRLVNCRRELASLDSLSRTTYVTPYGLASVYMALGDKDRAFQLLDLGIRQRSEDVVLLGVDPRMKSLRSDPRFAGILRRVGLPDAVTRHTVAALSPTSAPQTRTQPPDRARRGSAHATPSPPSAVGAAAGIP
jgi:serine/threonine-protein kinase